MKILMMTNTFTPIVGGLEKSIMTFSEAFRARGHEVKIVAPAFEQMPSQEKDVIRVPAIEKFVGTEFSLTIPLPEIVSVLVEEFKPDIVHSHHPFVMGDLALRLCGQKKIPLVFTYHTMFEHYTDKFGMDNQAVQQFVVELATGYANMADQVFVPSESVGKVLEERSVKTPIAVVPTGIDVKQFSAGLSSLRQKLKIPEKAFVVGHVGRLAPEKNLIFLTEAAAEFLKQKKAAYFLIVGSGPSERDMKKIFRAWGVTKQVCFAGVQKGQALVQAYKAMDVFAFASKSETQGIVLAEAMAAGLPVVGLDAPGVREVVKDMVNGRLLQEESRKKYASALLWCASRSASQWNAVKKAALETANAFSTDVCAEKALKIYEKVVRRHEVYAQEEIGQWQSVLGRFKTEIDMAINLGRAAGSAIVKAAVSQSPVIERISKYYQKEIDQMRKAWMSELLKLRKKNKEAPEDFLKKLDAVSEEITQKVRAYESDLTESNRKIAAACEAFEKMKSEGDAFIKSELEKIQNESPAK